jgi:amino acid permease
MSNSSALKRAKILWLSNFAIVLSPLFFTILILELDKYKNVRELLMNRLSGYQQVFFILMALAVVFMIVLGYKLYTEITHFTSIGDIDHFSKRIRTELRDDGINHSSALKLFWKIRCRLDRSRGECAYRARNPS